MLPRDGPSAVAPVSSTCTSKPSAWRIALRKLMVLISFPGGFVVFTWRYDESVCTASLGERGPIHRLGAAGPAR